jgi:WXG100 family type VII secretion target
MATIQVTPELLRKTSTEISKVNSDFNLIMNDIKTEMQKMKQRWESEAADIFISKFNGLNDDFQNYSKVIMDYANFLNTAADTYTNADKAIGSDSSGLKADA